MARGLLGRVFSVLLACAAPYLAHAGTALAVTQSGQVSGSEAGGLSVFLGIPYAAPPVGPLRWRAPQPAAKWAGVRPATEFGPSCMQISDRRSGIDPDRVSEDCLTVNVWTPAHKPGERLAVLVVIPGGGFFFGGSSIAPTDGANLARRGIVVVSFNYRLGAFGFLAHPMLSAEGPGATSGAYGLLDQIAALKWVQANIGGFGGDAAKVTILGESAGASSVLYLMVSPSAKGLFQGAIAESPGRVWIPPQHLRQAAFGLVSAEREGEALAPDIKTLRDLSAKEMQARAQLRADLFCDEAGVDYWPIVDGEVLPDDPSKLFAAGKAAHVPLLIGTDADEGTLFTLDCLRSIHTAAAWRDFLVRRYPAVADLLIAEYPAASDDQVRSAESRWIRDWGFTGSARAAARAVAAYNQPAYLYEFSHVNPRILPIPGVGSFHGIEMAYAFGNHAAQPGQADPFDEVDRALSESMQAAWVRFVRTGDPNGPGLPKWPRYAISDGQLMDFGDRPLVRGVRDPAALDAFDRAIAKLEAAP